jgi:hypothetical protein
MGRALLQSGLHLQHIRERVAHALNLLFGFMTFAGK